MATAMGNNRTGAAYNNWLTSLRADSARDLTRRTREEAEAEDREYWWRQLADPEYELERR